MRGARVIVTSDERVSENDYEKGFDTMKNADVVIGLEDVQANALREACRARVKELASHIGGKVTDITEIEELATMADTLLVVELTLAR